MIVEIALHPHNQNHKSCIAASSIYCVSFLFIKMLWFRCFPSLCSFTVQMKFYKKKEKEKEKEDEVKSRNFWRWYTQTEKLYVNVCSIPTSSSPHNQASRILSHTYTPSSHHRLGNKTRFFRTYYSTKPHNSQSKLIKVNEQSKKRSDSLINFLIQNIRDVLWPIHVIEIHDFANNQFEMVSLFFNQ